MKNKFILYFIFTIIFQPLLAENLNIQSQQITIDKKTKITIFKDQVIARDQNNNQLSTELAEYNKEMELLNSIGPTTVITENNFIIKGEDIIFDNKNNFIRSTKTATIKDVEGNNISLDNFEYSTEKNLFKSFGNIEIIDSKSNKYNFSQVYIDEKRKEIVGTDAKTFLNEDSFKINEKNKPRVFSNTVNIYDQKTKFTKSIFTICDYRKNDKCPPWSLQASQMLHDKRKKTIYYDKAIIKVYDIPIFFIPKLSHPDPSVERRSGFLIPSFADSKNLGASFDIPYYWALDKDKDFTLSSRLFTSEHPLFLGEYRHAFSKSDLILDMGYTEGYKKTTVSKKSGDKSHFFSKFVKNFKGNNDSNNSLEVTLQNVSNDKYLKLYKIKSNLVDYEQDNLENSIAFNRENVNSFLGFKASAYETLKDRCLSSFRTS